jgi:purine-cytosine permease-like protein
MIKKELAISANNFNIEIQFFINYLTFINYFISIFIILITSNNYKTKKYYGTSVFEQIEEG